MWKIVLLSGITVICLFILLFTVLIYRRVSVNTGCVGIPAFDPTRVYTKTLTIPIINKQISGSVQFTQDGQFTLVSEGDTYSGNTWIYDKENCQVVIQLGSAIQNVLNKYDCSVQPEVKLDKQGNLIVSGLIAGFFPLQVTLS